MIALLVTLTVNGWECVPADDRTHYTCRLGAAVRVIEHDPACTQREWIARDDSIRLVCRGNCHD